MDLANKLLEDERLMSNKWAKEGVEDILLLLKYLKIFGILDTVSFY